MADAEGYGTESDQAEVSPDSVPFEASNPNAQIGSVLWGRVIEASWTLRHALAQRRLFPGHRSAARRRGGECQGPGRAAGRVIRKAEIDSPLGVRGDAFNLAAHRPWRPAGVRDARRFANLATWIPPAGITSLRNR